MTATTEPWATLEIRLHDPGDGGWGEAGERLEALAALLAEDDRALGVETRDMSTLGQQALHPELIVYTRPDALADLSSAATRLGLALHLELELTPTVRTDDDWHDTWKQFYAPIVFGDGALLLRPSWLARRDGDPALELVLDPGRAFGTGQHETTRLCIDVLVELAAAGRDVRRVLDLGCGSGILALAAARLFPAAAIVAADNDPDATATAAENAAINALEPRLELRTGTVREIDGTHDLVLANIRPSVLIPIAGDLAAHVARGGLLVLSGILGEEADEVAAAYLAAGLRQLPRRDLGEWCALLFAAGDPA
jgi:ribosomal protein L11 methyltransferase